MIQSSSMVHKLQCICTYAVADWIAIHTADSTVQRPYNCVGALQRTLTQHTATHYNNDSIKSSGAAPISGRCLLMRMYIVHLRCSLLQCVAVCCSVLQWEIVVGAYVRLTFGALAYVCYILKYDDEHKHTHAHTHTRTHTHAHTHTHACTHTNAFTHTQMHTHTHTRIHTHTNAYTHTQTHTHTHWKQRGGVFSLLGFLHQKSGVNTSNSAHDNYCRADFWKMVLLPGVCWWL